MLDDGPNFRRLLILSDGMCDGGGMSFRLCFDEDLAGEIASELQLDSR
jgi:hypothetical protein